MYSKEQFSAKKHTEDVVKRYFDSPLRRAADAPTPPRGLNQDGPACDMSDAQQLLVGKLLHLWSVMGFGAAVLVEKLAELSGVAGSEEKHAILLKGLNDLLDAMKVLDPLVDAVGKYGLKRSLLLCQLDRCDDAIDDLAFLEEFKAEFSEV